MLLKHINILMVVMTQRAYLRLMIIILPEGMTLRLKNWDVAERSIKGFSVWGLLIFGTNYLKA